MQNRKFIIEANETVLCLTQWTSAIKGPISVISETPVIGREMTAADLLDELTDDGTVMIRRLNIETWASEDITEEVARQYLYAMDEREGVDLDDEDRFPAYVKNSRAWALWKDDLEAERRAISPRVIAYTDAGRPIREAVNV